MGIVDNMWGANIPANSGKYRSEVAQEARKPGWMTGKQKALDKSRLITVGRDAWVDEQRRANISDEEIRAVLLDYDATAREAGGGDTGNQKWLDKIKAEGATEDSQHQADLLAKNTDAADAEADRSKRYLRSRLARMSGIDSTFLTGSQGSKPKGIL